MKGPNGCPLGPQRRAARAGAGASIGSEGCVADLRLAARPPQPARVRPPCAPFLKMKLGRRSVSATSTAFVRAVMLASHAARAEDLCFTPTENVVTVAMFRAERNSESAPLGRLELGVSVAVIGDVPRWSQVRLADGATAYVFRGWTAIVPCGPLVLDAISGQMPTWNAGACAGCRHRAVCSCGASRFAAALGRGGGGNGDPTLAFEGGLR